MAARSKQRRRAGTPSRAGARASRDHQATLADRHVALVPPASGRPIQGGAIVVALEKLVVRKILAREGPAHSGRVEGLLVLDVGGHRTSVAWQGPRRAAFEVNTGRRLLFAGPATRPLEIDAELVESDLEETEWLAHLERTLQIAAAASRPVPGYGGAAAAGAGLASAIVDLIRSRIDHDVELRFLGSIGEPGASDAAPLPGVTPLLASSEPYRLVRRADDPAEQDEIEIHFSIHPFEASKVDPRQAIVVLLDRVELDLVGIGREDTLSIEARFVGGREPRSRKRKVMELSLAHELHDSGVWLERTLGLHNKVLYRGPWGGGVSFSFSVAALRSRLDAGLEVLLERTGALAAALVEEEKQEITSITQAAETVRATALKFLPEKRFAMSHSSAVAVGAASGRQPSGLYAVPDLDAWHPLAVELEDPNHGRVTFHLRVRKAD